MTKPCASCTKQIPEAALDCVFCGMRQPEAAPLAVDADRKNPLLGVGTGEIGAVIADAQPAQTNPTMAMAAVTMDAADEPPPETTDEIVTGEVLAPTRNWALLARVTLAMCGVLFVLLFLIPNQGVSSWTMLESAVGAEYLRRFYLLAGGIVLVALVALPVPAGFRVQIGMLLAGASTVIAAVGLAGWRAALGAIAVVFLAAMHLSAAEATTSRRTQLAVGASLLLLALLYVLPSHGVTALGEILHMLRSGVPAMMVTGAFFLIPVGFAGVSLLGLIGRDLSDIDLVLGFLLVLWGPVAVALLGFIVADRAQILIAMSLLVSTLAAAISAAEVLGHSVRTDRAR